MISFPNCKINLGLSILRKRADGFHDLETVFYPIPFTDALELIHDQSDTADISFSQSGLTVDGDVSNNLCVKAYRLLKQDFPELPPVKMHLHKVIPMGAGLGGGSADGAFALQLISRKFQLPLSQEQLLQYAAVLGSDGPFFIINKPCFAGGRGELLEEIQLSLASCHLVLVNPGIHINTGWAFSQLKPMVPDISIRHIISQPIESWKDQLQNDFELPVFQQYPVLAEIKKSLYEAGAVYAAMSGSGSTIFGIFNKKTAADQFIRDGYFVKTLDL